MKNILVFILFVIGLWSCNTTEPIEDTPGRRDYVWTVDSLDAPYDTYYRMWVSSPSDVWCVKFGRLG